MIDNAATDGERLCNYINHRLLASVAWNMLAADLETTGRASVLVDVYRQIAAVALTGRIVTAGVSLAQATDVKDLVFKREFTTLLRDYVGIPTRLFDEVYRASQRAVSAALEPLPNSVQKQMRAWALRQDSCCYICGVALTFNDPQLCHHSYTCDHVWPSAYGGNGVIDNLLPACHSCNSSKKANFATWVMPAIQSLVLGLSPAENRLQEIHGSYKFALHYRAAQELAVRKHITLKNAFLHIGPWEDVRIRDRDDVVDIFNLENHAAKSI
jgi:hypothetical protein